MANEKWLVDLYEFLKECDRLLKNPPFVHPATPWDRGLMIAVETALSLPTVDAVPVVHGRWIDGIGSYSTANCSVCGWKIPYCDDYYGYLGKTNYCPNCGAKMDGERREEE